MTTGEPAAELPRGAKNVAGSLLLAGCLLALILAVAKAMYVTDPPWSGVAAWTGASFADVAFALTCGVFGELLWLALRRWTRAAAAVRLLLLFLFAGFAAYGIAAVGLFAYFNRPLTFGLLGMVQ